MPGFPVDILFQDNEFTRPATYESKAGRLADINVIYESEYSPTLVGDTIMANKYPTAWCKTSNVSDASKDAHLTLHDYIEDENNERVLEPFGEPFIGTNVAKFNVITVHNDADGFTELLLSSN